MSQPPHLGLHQGHHSRVDSAILMEELRRLLPLFTGVLLPLVNQSFLVVDSRMLWFGLLIGHALSARCPSHAHSVELCPFCAQAYAVPAVPTHAEHMSFGDQADNRLAASVRHSGSRQLPCFVISMKCVLAPCRIYPYLPSQKPCLPPSQLPLTL